MKKIELAYLAGVMDSDGSFSIIKHMWRVKTQGKSPCYQEMVAISQCDPSALYLAQKLFGGNVRPEKYKTLERKPLFVWYVGNKVAANTARALLPYLRIKKRQAEILLMLRKIKNRGRKANTYKAGPHVTRLKPETIAEMDALAAKVRQLNDSRFPLTLN